MNACCCVAASPSDAVAPYTFLVLLLDLPFTVLRVALRALDPVHLPSFPGSKLEGTFGRALYRMRFQKGGQVSFSGEGA